MRKSILALTLALMTVGLGSMQTAAPAQAEISFSFFYSNLSRHGSWDVSAEFGDVWCPRTRRANWHPYEDGHWEATDLGWAWVSDYSWGAIPYHYGTWVQDRRLGWVWVPGYVWAPSWVVFRTGPDYIGWAPVAPSFSIGVSLGDYPSDRFVYVPSGQFLSRRVRAHRIPGGRARGFEGRMKLVNNIRIVNNIVVNDGPGASYIEGVTRRPVRQAPIERVRRASPEGPFRRDLVRVERERHPDGVRAAEPRHDNRRPEGDRGRGRGKEKKQKPGKPHGN